MGRILSMKERTMRRRTQIPCSAFLRAFTGIVLAGTVLLSPARGEYAKDGLGLRTVLPGTIPNAKLFWETRPTWINEGNPSKPYVVRTSFLLPKCEQIPLARLAMTVWGGTADYTCRMTLRVNEVEVPGAAPFLFGSTSDTASAFRPDVPNAYGSGYGVWLVTIPIPGNLLFTDGSTNVVEVIVDTPDSFDGRIKHITLLAICQSPTFNNQLDYAIAEGSGDIYRTPKETRVDRRTVMLPANPNNVSSATLKVLYTYGTVEQNDRLYFNDTQLDGDNVAAYDKNVSGLNYGPDVVEFDVSSLVRFSNTVTFSVSEEVPDTREYSLRPQLVALAVTHPAAMQPPALDIAVNVVISWPVTSEKYQLESCSDLEGGVWTPVEVQPVILNGQNVVLLPPAAERRFYRLRKVE